MHSNVRVHSLRLQLSRTVTAGVEAKLLDQYLLDSPAGELGTGGHTWAGAAICGIRLGERLAPKNGIHATSPELQQYSVDSWSDPNRNYCLDIPLLPIFTDRWEGKHVGRFQTQARRSYRPGTLPGRYSAAALVLSRSVISGWLIGVGGRLDFPSVYRSGTLILVEQPTVPSQYVVPNIVSDNLQDRLQSITQQILSRTRLMHIIESQNLYSKGSHRLTQDDAIDRMRKDIEIELVHDRDQLTAFNIYYSSHDPHSAQQVTRELTNLFITENLEARQEQSENTTQFLESHLEEARKSLSEQEEKIREFKDQHLGDLPGQLQSNLQILSGLQTQLGAEQDALNRAKQQSVYLDSVLGQYRAVQRSNKSDDSVSIGLPAVQRELDRLKAKLADLSSHYTDRHPDVRKVKEQIAKTETMKQQIIEDLKAKAATPATESGSTDRPESDAEIKEMSPTGRTGEPVESQPARDRESGAATSKT